MIFYIESNGFCATTWLSEALKALPGVVCFHGTRVIPGGDPMGSPYDLEAADFVAELLRVAAREDKVAGAVHGKFGADLGELVKREGGHYALAVRHPVARIQSCASWARTKVENGEPVLLHNAVDLCRTFFRTDFAFDELIFAFAVLHVIAYDYQTMKPPFVFDAVYRMEDYTTDAGALGRLAAAATGGRMAEPAVLDALIGRQRVNSHDGRGKRDPQEIFAAWSDKRRRLFTHVASLFATHEGRLYDRLGYDLAPFGVG